MNAAIYTVRHPLSALRIAGRYLGAAASWAYEKSGLKHVVDAGIRIAKDIGRRTGITEWAKEKAEQARRAYHEARAAITRKAKEAVAYAVKHNPIPEIIAAARPLITVATMVVTGDPRLPALLLSSARNVIVDAAKAADSIRQAVVEQVGAVVEDVKNAVDSVDWGDVWDGVKTVGNVVGEVTGFNDIKNCVTKGDMEACAWAVATVAGVALGGAGAGLVRAAKAGRMASKAAKYADDIAKAAREGRRCGRDGRDGHGVRRCGGRTGRGQQLLARHRSSDGRRLPQTDRTSRGGRRGQSHRPDDRQDLYSEVTDTIKGEGLKKLVTLTVDTDGDKGDATDTITATDGHPFWVASLDKWLKAGELKPGQWLRTGSGSWVQVDAVQAWTQPASVYNLTVDTAHTYFVGVGARPSWSTTRGAKPSCLSAQGLHGSEADGSRQERRSDQCSVDASGNTYFDFSRHRSRADIRELPISLRRVVDQTGHHGGSAEIGCIAQAMEAGDLDARGSRSLAMVHRPFDNARNRDLLPGCDSCQAVMSRLRVTDTFGR